MEQITVHNRVHLLPDDLLRTAAIPFADVTFDGLPIRVSLKGGNHGPRVAGELAFTMEKHGQSHPWLCPSTMSRDSSLCRGCIYIPDIGLPKILTAHPKLWIFPVSPFHLKALHPLRHYIDFQR